MLKRILFILCLLLNSPCVYADVSLNTINLPPVTLKDKVFKEVRHSIFEIYAIDKDKDKIKGTGTAVAVTNHLLATNCHIALLGNFLVMRVADKPYLARLCYFNQKEDICIFDVNGYELTPVKLRLSSEVKKGEQAFAVGNPNGNDTTITEGKITDILHPDNRIILETDALVTFGSSGGGLFDKDSNLIGITTWGIPQNNMSFAISTELITEVITPGNNASSCHAPLPN